MYEEYLPLLKKRLTPERYTHSLNVADSAVYLAEQYGADPEKAYLAGLLHDVCKNESHENLLQMLSQFGIILSIVERNAPKLWHAMAGAAYIQQVLGVEDKDVLRAVRYHTTARAGMSVLEKVLYLADFISADRDYDGVEDLRRAAEESMEKAMLQALRFSIVDLCEQDKAVHPDTLEAYNETVLGMPE